MIATIFLASILGLLLVDGTAGYCLACVQVDLSSLRRTRTTARQGLQEAATMVRTGRNTLAVVDFLEATLDASPLPSDDGPP